MPIREACHVAVQRNHPSKHRLWKHALARQDTEGQGPTPVLAIVCMSIWMDIIFFQSFFFYRKWLNFLLLCILMKKLKKKIRVCVYPAFIKIFVISSIWPKQVSYGSELSNRGPTFDMDLSDFLDGDQPISYEKAKNYFARDPSQK